MHYTQQRNNFVSKIAVIPRMTEHDKAISLLWFEDHFNAGADFSAAELANQLHDLRLTGRVNKTRLEKNLSKSKSTIKSSKSSGKFQIALRQKPDLDEKYLPLLSQPKVTVSDSLLPESQTKGTRQYIEKLSHQINGCYESGFYDACAVMCRRLIESLLIEAFKKAGHIGVIQDNNVFMGFDDIIRQAKSGQYIKLPRGTDKLILKVKEVGDTAAHDRFHITSEHDIADFRTGFRKVISQLMGLADIR